MRTPTSCPTRSTSASARSRRRSPPSTIGPVSYDPADIARAGVFVSIDADGSALGRSRLMSGPRTKRPVRTDGEADGETDTTTPATPIRRASVQRAVITIGGQPPSRRMTRTTTIKPLPERLVIELTAYRTLALRDAVANNPHVAMTALLHKLGLDTFHALACTRARLEAAVGTSSSRSRPTALKDSPSAKAVAGAARGLGRPTSRRTMTRCGTGSRHSTRPAAWRCSPIASAIGVNALYEKAEPLRRPGVVAAHGSNMRLAQADRLARAIGLDMVEAGWRPTVDNYLGRVTKPRILEAVREGAGERAAQLIDHLKKGDMAKEAERLLADTGWLPEPLRLADVGRSASRTRPMPTETTTRRCPTSSRDDERGRRRGRRTPAVVAAE